MELKKGNAITDAEQTLEFKLLPGGFLSVSVRSLINAENEEMRFRFRWLGKPGRVYTESQKEYALSQVNIYGVRATSRILELPRRTIQRWCRQDGKLVKRCPSWVYDWAERKRKRREFWERRGYS